MGAVIKMRKPRRATVDDGRVCIRLLPQGWPESSNWLYAVGFADGTVKVGRASRPRDRMFSYWRDHRQTVAWMHVFGRIAGEKSEAMRLERMALARCAQVGERINKTEFFRGLDKATALRCVRAACAEV